MRIPIVNKEVDGFLVLMALGMLLFMAGIIGKAITTPVQYHACQGGWAGQCVDFDSYDQVRIEGNCLIKGTERICGNYTVDRYK